MPKNYDPDQRVRKVEIQFAGSNRREPCPAMDGGKIGDIVSALHKFAESTDRTLAGIFWEAAPEEEA